MNLQNYWTAVLKQDPNAMSSYFQPNACIRWHNTNEHFTVDEFIQANCEYPEKWDGEIQRVVETDDLIITVTHVLATTKPLSFHVTSFIKLEHDKIAALDEYWGDDGLPPQWRVDKKLGTAINNPLR